MFCLACCVRIVYITLLRNARTITSILEHLRRLRRLNENALSVTGNGWGSFLAHFVFYSESDVVRYVVSDDLVF